MTTAVVLWHAGRSRFELYGAWAEAVEARLSALIPEAKRRRDAETGGLVVDADAWPEVRKLLTFGFGATLAEYVAAADYDTQAKALEIADRRLFGMELRLMGYEAGHLPTARDYRALHVMPDAPPEVVTAAYKALARRHHPDTGTADGERMKAINDAYDRLSGKAAKEARYAG